LEFDCRVKRLCRIGMCLDGPSDNPCIFERALSRRFRCAAPLFQTFVPALLARPKSTHRIALFFRRFFTISLFYILLLPSRAHSATVFAYSNIFHARLREQNVRCVPLRPEIVRASMRASRVIADNSQQRQRETKTETTADRDSIAVRNYPAITH